MSDEPPTIEALSDRLNNLEALTKDLATACADLDARLDLQEAASKERTLKNRRLINAIAKDVRQQIGLVLVTIGFVVAIVLAAVNLDDMSKKALANKFIDAAIPLVIGAAGIVLTFQRKSKTESD